MANFRSISDGFRIVLLEIWYLFSGHGGPAFGAAKLKTGHASLMRHFFTAFGTYTIAAGTGSGPVSGHSLSPLR
jgi:hypothetical protein